MLLWQSSSLSPGFLAASWLHSDRIYSPADPVSLLCCAVLRRMPWTPCAAATSLVIVPGCNCHAEYPSVPPDVPSQLYTVPHLQRLFRASGMNFVHRHCQRYKPIGNCRLYKPLAYMHEMPAQPGPTHRPGTAQASLEGGSYWV
jgi:hypothetical protein